ncbi:hypothetical protein [Pelagicoccus albus]|uniref:Uncharacterized protein n=1 Tax=Pelagicoccus albus TaxID=415222 RepID=A0A7X1B6W4_9BACT|nr:hypothetical protein [Pelagicoccus albus]MBC2606760.1 hypothetical protein [Pelagicoccus albus]
MAVLPVATDSVSSFVEGDSEDWGLVHVLAEECPCSRSVLDYLLERGANSGVREEVILLDATDESVEKLRELGFLVSTADSEGFCSRFGSEGVPFFQVVEGGAKPSYSGAYFDNAFRATGGFLDLKTLSRLQGGGIVVNRPVYGCATSDRLKAVLDPLGLKYAIRN